LPVTIELATSQITTTRKTTTIAMVMGEGERERERGVDCQGQGYLIEGVSIWMLIAELSWCW